MLTKEFRLDSKHLIIPMGTVKVNGTFKDTYEIRERTIVDRKVSKVSVKMGAGKEVVKAVA